MHSADVSARRHPVAAFRFSRTSRLLYLLPPGFLHRSYLGGRVASVSPFPLYIFRFMSFCLHVLAPHSFSLLRIHRPGPSYTRAMVLETQVPVAQVVKGGLVHWYSWVTWFLSIASTSPGLSCPLFMSCARVRISLNLSFPVAFLYGRRVCETLAVAGNFLFFYAGGSSPLMSLLREDIGTDHSDVPAILL